jgi:hypothetical protein
MVNTQSLGNTVRTKCEGVAAEVWQQLLLKST